MKKFIQKHYQNIIVVLSAIITIIGFSIYYYQSEESYTIFDVVYSSIRLFVLDNDAENEKLNVFLQIGRFVAPASLAIAVIMGILNIFSKSLKIDKVKKYSNHIIFLGNNENLLSIIQNEISNNRKTVLVTLESMEQVNGVSERIIHLTFPEITNDYLDNLAFYSSKYIVISNDNDLKSIDMANKLVQQINCDKLKQPIDIILLFNSPEWSELNNNLKLLEKTNQEILNNRFLNIRYINYYDKYIRKLLQESAPDIFKPVTSPDDESPNLLIIGFNEIARRLIIGMALYCHYLNLKKQQVYVWSDQLNGIDRFIKKYQLSNMLEIIPIGDIRHNNINKTIDVAYLCEDESLCLFQALSDLEFNEYLMKAKKIICSKSIYNKELFSNRVNAIYSLKEQINSISVLIDDSIDQMAKIIHVNYLTQRAKEEDLSTDIDTHREWDILPDETKDRNRYPADHISLKVRSMGCKIVAGQGGKDEFDIKSFQYLEELSHAEHNRWCAYMYYKGWRYNKIRKNDLKLHHDLVPYNDLSEKDKQKDRDNILQIPELLSIIDKRIVKA